MPRKVPDRLGRLASHGAVALLAFLAGGLLFPEKKPGAPLETERETMALSRLTSPYLECPGTMDADLSLVQARNVASRYIRAAQEGDNTLRISLYARDLNNGPWIGINEREAFLPASLSKVPLMIYILSQAEADRGILDEEVVFPGVERMSDEDSMEGAPEEIRLQPGQSYTYSDLLYRMIAYSDNHAKELLMTGIGSEDVNRLMSSIHAQENLLNGLYTVSPKTYSALFRALYNASFLGRPLSEYALSLLSEGFFQGALRRHIPDDVTVASKFGHIDAGGGSGGEVQLHECGIIYQPGSPYLLCVMTKSSSAPPDRLAEIIADLSLIVWEEKGG